MISFRAKLSAFQVGALGLIILGSILSAQPTFAALTEEQAIERANAFCQAMGWKPEAAPTAVLKPPDGFSHYAEWEVSYGSIRGGTLTHDVEVEAETGEFMSAQDYTVPDRPASLGAARLSEEEAIKIATKYAKILGLPEDARLEEAVLRGTATHFTGRVGDLMRNPSLGQELMQWEVSWERVFRGIPYQGDGMRVWLHPDTGQLSHTGKRFSVPVPPPVPEPLAREEAVRRAWEYLRELAPTHEIVAVLGAELEVVQPNYYWTDQRSLQVLGRPSRIAWVVSLESPPNWEKVVHVDAEKGVILGGTQSMGAIRPIKAPPSKKDSKRALLLALGVCVLLAGLFALGWKLRKRRAGR